MMLALGHVVAEAAGLLGRLFALLWSVLGWGVWLMFAVWVPISFVGLAIGAMLGCGCGCGCGCGLRARRSKRGGGGCGGGAARSGS